MQLAQFNFFLRHFHVAKNVKGKNDAVHCFHCFDALGWVTGRASGL